MVLGGYLVSGVRKVPDKIGHYKYRFLESCFKKNIYLQKIGARSDKVQIMTLDHTPGIMRRKQKAPQTNIQVACNKSTKRTKQRGDQTMDTCKHTKTYLLEQRIREHLDKMRMNDMSKAILSGSSTWVHEILK